MGARRRGTVLFVDNVRWDCLFQLAAGVRRGGWRAVRVTTNVPRRIETAGELAFNRTIILDQSELCRLPELLASEKLVDVQCLDEMLSDVVQGLAPLAAQLPYADWVARARATDKWEVAQALRSQGVAVPETLSLAETTAQEAVERLGFPLVVKQAVASGGAGVTIVKSRDELDGALRGPPEGRFYERFVAGDTLHYAALVADDGVRASTTYTSYGRIATNGPPSDVFSVNDPQVNEIGEAVSDILGLRGFVNIDLIRDADGRAWVHDVNPRVWGPFLSFRAMGVDFLQSYLEWLDGSERPWRRAMTTAGASADVFPGALERVVAGRGIRRYEQGIRWAAPYIRQLGWKYLAVELVSKREFFLSRGSGEQRLG